MTFRYNKWHAVAFVFMLVIEITIAPLSRIEQTIIEVALVLALTSACMAERHG